jgi:hypothetical protein
MNSQALDITTLTIMRILPREVDPSVYHMMNESPGEVSFNAVGGLNDQIRELREVIICDCSAVLLIISSNNCFYFIGCVRNRGGGCGGRR